jgi:multidrug efflux pump subunit AcrA (membrane-fusion protein)
MLRKYLLPIIALLGALFGLYIVFWSQKSVPTPPILFPPPTSPYPHAIAGSGLIEASSQNIAIGCPFNEVIDRVFVVEGDEVKAGDVLFQLDLRFFQSQVEIAKADFYAAIVNLQDKFTQYTFYLRLRDKRAVSEQIYEQYHYAWLEAQENVNVAWANLEAAEVNIQRSIIRAPVNGKILQVNAHVGEIAPVTPFTNGQAEWQTLSQGSLMLMGNIDPMQVRIDIDEDDAWRYENGSRATAFVRGNSHIRFPLTYLRVEPYIIPKSSFTGVTAERVDTRVLQVLYSFEKKELPVYVGQVVDVFIESKPFEHFITP